MLYNNLQTTLIQYPGGKSGAVTIPGTVTEIGDNSFKECLNIGSVTIPSGVTTIGRTAFYGCSLTSVTIPASVTTIKVQAFRTCPNLTSIDVDAANTAFSSQDGVLYNKARHRFFNIPRANPARLPFPAALPHWLRMCLLTLYC